jgi:flavin reductase (DIM6/NTAB) family NADH-FMN oxidoreductase RutF
MIPDWPPGTVAVLTTAGPHAIPVSTAMRAGPASVLLALGPSRGSLARLREDPRCALALIADGVAITLRGRAAEIGEAAGTVALRLEVEAVDDHMQSTFAIEAGVRWRWTDPQAERRDAEVRAALAQLA